MAPPGLFQPLDPTMHFLLSTFCTIVFVDADPQAKTLSVKVPTPEELREHFLDPGVLIGLGVFAAFLFAVRNESKPLSRSQSLAANWHLWNAVLICALRQPVRPVFSLCLSPY